MQEGKLKKVRKEMEDHTEPLAATPEEEKGEGRSRIILEAELCVIGCLY